MALWGGEVKRSSLATEAATTSRGGYEGSWPAREGPTFLSRLRSLLGCEPRTTAASRAPSITHFVWRNTARMWILSSTCSAAVGGFRTTLTGQFGVELQRGANRDVFWASWCLPSSAQVAWIDRAFSTNEKGGFRVPGINVDTPQSDGPQIEPALSSIRRFLLDHNVR